MSQSYLCNTEDLDPTIFCDVPTTLPPQLIANAVAQFIAECKQRAMQVYPTKDYSTIKGYDPCLVPVWRKLTSPLYIAAYLQGCQAIREPMDILLLLRLHRTYLITVTYERQRKQMLQWAANLPQELPTEPYDN